MCGKPLSKRLTSDLEGAALEVLAGLEQLGVVLDDNGHNGRAGLHSEVERALLERRQLGLVAQVTGALGEDEERDLHTLASCSEGGVVVLTQNWTSWTRHHRRANVARRRFTHCTQLVTWVLGTRLLRLLPIVPLPLTFLRFISWAAACIMPTADLLLPRLIKIEPESITEGRQGQLLDTP